MKSDKSNSKSSFDKEQNVYFEDLDLDDRLLDALYDMHFEKCTPIQAKAIPAIIQGKDLVGLAQTGTGKTAAYLLPILSKLCSNHYQQKNINCLIIVPTRELAQQIDQAIDGFSYYLPISSVAIYGGNDGIRYENERNGLSKGADIVITTPGRFLSHIQLGNVNLSNLSFFVLDEADRMLDMGFIDDIMLIVKKIPSRCQTLLFSATMPEKIQQLTKELLHNPIEIKIAISKPSEKISQKVLFCYERQKIRLIQYVFQKIPPQKVIIFASSKQSVKDLTTILKRKKYRAEEMHSDLSQKERDSAMISFKAQQIDILVATDIVSRGIDIEDLQMVINYDIPHHAEDYIHRIGRTARAGKVGLAFSFVNEKDLFYFDQIEKLLQKKIDVLNLPKTLGESPSFMQEAGKKRSKTPPHKHTYRKKPHTST